MFRPQGAWWWQAKDLSFTVSGTTLRLQHVIGRFYFSRGYDLGEKDPPSLFVSTERSVAGSDRLETRSVGNVADAMMNRCGFHDPLDAEVATVTCADLERAAVCLTSTSAAEVRSRARSTPSFVERGGRP